MLEADASQRAIRIALEVAARVTDRVRLQAALTAARVQTSFPKSIYWEAPCVAQGDAGLALMCAYVDACIPNEGWDVTAHSFLETAVRGAERTVAVSDGLFTGLSGLAFATWALS